MLIIRILQHRERLTRNDYDKIAVILANCGSKDLGPRSIRRQIKLRRVFDIGHFKFDRNRLGGTKVLCVVASTCSVIPHQCANEFLGVNHPEQANAELRKWRGRFVIQELADTVAYDAHHAFHVNTVSCPCSRPFRLPKKKDSRPCSSCG